MKAEFTTTIDDLKEIIESARGLKYKLEINNIPVHRMVEVTVDDLGDEDVFNTFMIENDLWDCIKMIEDDI